MTQIVISVIGGLISGLALMWAIFTWIIGRRDKMHELNKSQLIEMIHEREDRADRYIKALMTEMQECTRSINELKVRFAAFTEKDDVIKKQFLEYVSRINKILDAHQSEIGKLGKIIRVAQGK